MPNTNAHAELCGFSRLNSTLSVIGAFTPTWFGLFPFRLNQNSRFESQDPNPHHCLEGRGVLNKSNLIHLYCIRVERDIIKLGKIKNKSGLYLSNDANHARMCSDGVCVRFSCICEYVSVWGEHVITPVVCEGTWVHTAPSLWDVY